MLDLTSGRHAAYCARHGITYWPVFGEVPSGRHPAWSKIALIRAALEMGFATVVWLDADTLIVRDDEDIRGALDPAGGPLALAQHPSPGLDGTTTHDNTGVMVMRNTSRVREFFTAVWQAGPLGDHVWHEQARMLDLLPAFPGLRQRLDDRWNATVGANEAAEPVIKAWHGEGPGALSVIYDELKKIGAVDARVAQVATAFVNGDNAVERAAQFIKTIPPYPAQRFAGRGLVICGGGALYFTCAWVVVQQLRRLGCTLPVQLWHLGPHEVDDRMRALMAPLDVECIDGRALRKQFPARILNGWELKPYAMLHCPFREVLLLDADNLPVVNPEFLFDGPAYQDTGAIFWPDYERMKPDRPAWHIFDVPYRDEPEFESGQILLDKSRVWPALNLAMWYNEHSDFFYHHVHGDKETFHFAWRRLGFSYAMPPFPIQWLPDTMCQHDFDGHRIFQHRNTAKWNLHGANPRIPGFLFEEECLADLARLREVWDGIVRG